MKKRIITGLLILMATGLFGCGVKENNIISTETAINAISSEDPDQNLTEEDEVTYDSYEQVINGLSEEQAYLYYQFEGMKNQVLVVADGTYDNGDRTLVAIGCRFYMTREDGRIIEIGGISSNGTAYPIAVSGSYIFACGNHFVGKYSIREADQSIVLEESGTEEFDENGIPTYTYFTQETKEDRVVKDDSKLQALYKEYSEATVLNFSHYV